MRGFLSVLADYKAARCFDYQAGDEVGVKSCTLEFEGEYTD